MKAHKEDVRVWDPFVRIGHWIVVLAFAIAYVTEDDAIFLHSWAGYIVAGYVVIRVLWGLIGPRHARFSDFVFKPAKALRYALDLLSFRATRYLGHSPAGGAMVVLLLVMLALTTVSGMATFAVDDGRGPFAAWLSPAPERVHDNRRGEESWLGEIHEALAELTLVLIILHTGGVLWASIVHRENLVRAMITGRKRPNPD